jgi:hypothetical protein
MDAHADTRVCRLCAETIKAAAKVCPYCRKIQKRGLFFTKYDCLALAVPFIFLGTILLLGKMFIRGRSFSSSRDNIEVLNSEVAMETSRDYTNVVVVGVLTNKSDHAWQIGEFEVRYLNSSGKAVDVMSGWEGFTVLPHSNHSFRLTFYSRTSIPEHTSRKVSVRSAKDPNAWFVSD